MKDKINIFIDDTRMPIDIKTLMGKFFVSNWVIVRNYPDFVKVVDANINNIGLVSFDHDLACFVDNVEKTGKDCADYLIYKCIDNNIDFPDWFIHTQNIIGKPNILSVILTYLKLYEGKTPKMSYHNSGIIKNNIC